MPIIDHDEHGPWMDLGHTAIRPIGPTRFKLGESIDERHFPGSTLHGVGKVAGVRGSYQEAWIVGPKSRELHRDHVARQTSRGAALTDFKHSFRSYLVDLGAFKRGNPSFDPRAPFQSMMSLQKGHDAYLAKIGFTFWKGIYESNLISEGLAMSQHIAASGIASQIAAEIPQPTRSKSNPPRV